MQVLLDTHAFLWFIQNDPHLSAVARDSIEDEATDVFLSAASLWEMAIKHSIGKLNLINVTDSFSSHVHHQLLVNEIEILDISTTHVLGVASLPMLHHDPFDRLLVVQSHLERIPIISFDALLDDYGVERIW